MSSNKKIINRILSNVDDLNKNSLNFEQGICFVEHSHKNNTNKKKENDLMKIISSKTSNKEGFDNDLADAKEAIQLTDELATESQVDTSQYKVNGKLYTDFLQELLQYPDSNDFLNQIEPGNYTSETGIFLKVFFKEKNSGVYYIQPEPNFLARFCDPQQWRSHWIYTSNNGFNRGNGVSAVAPDKSTDMFCPNNMYVLDKNSWTGEIIGNEFGKSILQLTNNKKPPANNNNENTIKSPTVLKIQLGPSLKLGEPCISIGNNFTVTQAIDPNKITDMLDVSFEDVRMLSSDGTTATAMKTDGWEFQEDMGTNVSKNECMVRAANKGIFLNTGTGETQGGYFGIIPNEKDGTTGRCYIQACDGDCKSTGTMFLPKCPSDMPWNSSEGEWGEYCCKEYKCASTMGRANLDGSLSWKPVTGKCPENYTPYISGAHGQGNFDYCCPSWPMGIIGGSANPLYQFCYPSSFLTELQGNNNSPAVPCPGKNCVSFNDEIPKSRKEVDRTNNNIAPGIYWAGSPFINAPTTASNAIAGVKELPRCSGTIPKGTIDDTSHNNVCPIFVYKLKLNDENKDHFDAANVFYNNANIGGGLFNESNEGAQNRSVFNIGYNDTTNTVPQNINLLSPNDVGKGPIYNYVKGNIYVNENDKSQLYMMYANTLEEAIAIASRINGGDKSATSSEMEGEGIPVSFGGSVVAAIMQDSANINNWYFLTPENLKNIRENQCIGDCNAYEETHIYIATPMINEYENSTCSNNIYELDALTAGASFGSYISDTPGKSSCTNGTNTALIQDAIAEAAATKKIPLIDNNIIDDMKTNLSTESNTSQSLVYEIGAKMKKNQTNIDNSVNYFIKNLEAKYKISHAEALQEDRQLQLIGANYNYYAWCVAAITLVAITLKAHN